MAKRAAFTTHDVHRATQLGRMRLRDALKLADQLRADPRRDARLARGMCGPCFYQFRLAGQAFTAYTCRICEGQHSHPNTAVPVLCPRCAAHHGLCGQCGAQLDDPGTALPGPEERLRPPADPAGETGLAGEEA